MVLLDNLWTVMSQSTYSPQAGVNALASACCTLSFPPFLGGVGHLEAFYHDFDVGQIGPNYFAGVISRNFDQQLGGSKCTEAAHPFDLLAKRQIEALCVRNFNHGRKTNQKTFAE